MASAKAPTVVHDTLDGFRQSLDGFRKLEANFAFLDKAQNVLKSKKENTVMGLLSRVDLETQTVTVPSFEKNYKFATSIKAAPKDKLETYNNAIKGLVCLELPEKYFQGRIREEKEGLLMYDNEYGTAIRLWSTKKVGKSIIYEITVATYKDAFVKSIEGLQLQ